MTPNNRNAEAIRKAQSRLSNLKDLREDLNTIPVSLRYVFLAACDEKIQRVSWVEKEGQHHGI